MSHRQALQDQDLDAPKSGHADPKNAAAWAAVCAKIGLPGAAYRSVGGTIKDLHDQRKNLRRAINTIASTIAPGDEDPQTFNGLQHAGSLVAKIELMLDLAKDSAQPSKSAMNVMRTRDDFAAHYNSHGGSDGGDFGVAEFLRGVAGGDLQGSPQRSQRRHGHGGRLHGAQPPHADHPRGAHAGIEPAPSGRGHRPAQRRREVLHHGSRQRDPDRSMARGGRYARDQRPDLPGSCRHAAQPCLPVQGQPRIAGRRGDIEEALRVAIAQSFRVSSTGRACSGLALRRNRAACSTLRAFSPSQMARTARPSPATPTSSALLQAILQADAPMPTAAIMSPRSLVKLGGPPAAHQSNSRCATR